MPVAPQGNTFTSFHYHMHMNAKGKEMMWDLGTKNTKQIKALEEQTGVNLDPIIDHKLNIEN